MTLHSDQSPWEQYRRRRNAFWAAFATFAVVVLLSVIDASLDPGQQLIQRFWWIGLLVFVWGYVSQILLTWWPCPQCKQPYFRRSMFYGNWFTNKCLHCGLPKWAEPSPVPRGA